MTHAPLRARAALMSLAAGLSLSAPACTVIYAFNSDPGGLACESGQCLDGYTCVDNICVNAGAKKAGDLCAKTAECESGLYCGSQYRQCVEGDPAADNGANDDVNCALTVDEDEDMRCRLICDPAETAPCPQGQRCWLPPPDTEGVTGFCQQGTCAADSECASQDALCSGAIGLGKLGTCSENCDPLECTAQTCSGCEGLDGVPDAPYTCAPPIFESVTLRTVCTDAGGIPPYGACGSINGDLCSPGTFCIESTTGGSPFCSPWCRFPSGAPACPNQSDVCTLVGGSVGFCTPG